MKNEKTVRAASKKEAENQKQAKCEPIQSACVSCEADELKAQIHGATRAALEAEQANGWPVPSEPSALIYETTIMLVKTRHRLFMAFEDLAPCEFADIIDIVPAGEYVELKNSIRDLKYQLKELSKLIKASEDLFEY